MNLDKWTAGSRRHPPEASTFLKALELRAICIEHEDVQRSLGGQVERRSLMNAKDVKMCPRVKQAKVLDLCMCFSDCRSVQSVRPDCVAGIQRRPEIRRAFSIRSRHHPGWLIEFSALFLFTVLSEKKKRAIFMTIHCLQSGQFGNSLSLSLSLLPAS